MTGRILRVDPGELRAPPSRRGGADPFKLQRQIARFGTATTDMPPLWVYQCADGPLVIFDGVTRATRVAKLLPGVLIPVQVVGRVSWRCSELPKIGGLLS